MDIYEAMKDTNAFKHLHFEENECVYDAMNDSMFEDLSKATKDYADEAVEHFISDKRDYLTMPVFDLVDITHKWSVWQTLWNMPNYKVEIRKAYQMNPL